MKTDQGWRGRACVVVAAAVLAACGGGGEGEAPVACDTASQKSWLRSYMNDHYFWYRSSPNPSPEGFETVDAYFAALLYNGTHSAFPTPDRWSFSQSTEAFNRLYGDGETMGYGIFVAGLEVQGNANAPLYVRHVEPRSPAALAGVVRGDRVISLNGRSASDIIAANDYSALAPSGPGQALTIVLRNVAGIDRTLTLQSAIFALTPVPHSAVVTSPLGRRVGYLMVKDMINQAASGTESAFAQFRAQGVHEVVLDLRYNGGGLVSFARTLSSHVTGPQTNGQPFAMLLYNDKQRHLNQTVSFTLPTNALSGLSRVYVLAGPRTCSASEQVINGLRPFVNVVAVGDTTCGKPVGFLPEDNQCGTTYNAVNFESVNARNEGRYFNGLAPTTSCAVAEDFTRPLGATTEPLLAAAMQHADTGSCGVTAAREQPMRLKPQGSRVTEPGERPQMLPW